MARGRPPKDPATRRSHFLTFRTRAELQGKLAAAAAETGRSISEEAEHRLERSFLVDAELNQALGRVIDLENEARRDRMAIRLLIDRMPAGGEAADLIVDIDSLYEDAPRSEEPESYRPSTDADHNAPLQEAPEQLQEAPEQPIERWLQSLHNRVTWLERMAMKNERERLDAKEEEIFRRIVREQAEAEEEKSK